MSVLIKDMGKPKSCYAVIDGESEYCPFVNTDDDCVLLLKKGTCEGTWEEQYSKCPLVETPEPREDATRGCTYKPDCPWSDGAKCNSPNDPTYNECDYDRGIFPESYNYDPRADIYYLAEKIGIHRLYALVVELRGEPEPCEDAVSRKDVIDLYKRGAEIIAKAKGISVEDMPHNGLDALMNLPSVTPKEQRWIPCVDGNEPKANADCWISTNAKYVRRASYAPKTKNQPNGFIVTVGSFGFYEYGKSVKAWMLYEEPEPYKTKENEL